MSSVPEIWKPVPGFPYYEASNHGRIRSVDRFVRNKWGSFTKRCGQILKLTPHRGYFSIRLSNGERIINFGVHQVIAMAFHGLPPFGMVIDHVNTNKIDNRPENLEYVTNSENVKRQYNNGLLTNRKGDIGRWRHLNP